MSKLGLCLGELYAGALGEDGKGGFCSVEVGSRGVGCPLVRNISLDLVFGSGG